MVLVRVRRTIKPEDFSFLLFDGFSRFPKNEQGRRKPPGIGGDLVWALWGPIGPSLQGPIGPYRAQYRALYRALFWALFSLCGLPYSAVWGAYN